MHSRQIIISDEKLSYIADKKQYRMVQSGVEIIVGGDDTTHVLPRFDAVCDWAYLRHWHKDSDSLSGGKQECKSYLKDQKSVEIPIGKTGRTHRVKEGSVCFETDFSTEADLPETDYVEYEIELSENLSALKQLALTQEEIEWGNLQNEDCVDSYAFYDLNTKRKFGHLYRSAWIASDGSKIWVDQFIVDGNKLRVNKAPTAWMQEHGFPVTLDPTYTFGYDSGHGSQAYGLYTTRQVAAKVTSPSSSGYVTKVSASLSFFNINASGVVGAKATCSIYDCGTDPDDLVGATQEVVAATNISSTKTWIDFPFSSGNEPDVTSSGVYALSIGGGTTSGSVFGYLSYDSSGGAGSWYATQAYTGGSAPDPFPSAVSINSNYIFSIYAEYEESGGTPEFGAALAATGGFSVGGQKLAQSSSALSVDSALGLVGEKIAFGSADLVSSATITVGGEAVSEIPEFGAALAATSGFSVGGQKLAQSSSALSVDSALGLVGEKIAFGSADLVSSATITVGGEAVSEIPEFSAAMAATSGFSVGGQKLAQRSSALSVDSALGLVGEKIAFGFADLVSSATITVGGEAVSEIPELGAALAATGGFSVGGQKLARSPTMALSASALNAISGAKIAQSDIALAAAAILDIRGFKVGSIAITGPVSLVVGVVGAGLNFELINPQIEIEVR